MPELTLQNIELIASDIRRQDVSFSHLLDELVDHVCCDIENEMEHGLSFNEAYHKVKQRISPNQFSEIQKETLFAVDSKYRFMKNTMKISGIAGTLLFGTAALFKIQHWAGASILMTLGAFILAFVFLPSALGVMWKETHNKKRVFFFVSAFFTGFFFIAGTLFKVNHWPFAAVALILSVISSVALLIPSLMLFLREPEKKPYRAVLVCASVGFIFYVIGFVFKIQHWPLATLLIVSGMMLVVYVSIPWYTFKAFRNENGVSSSFLFLLIAFILILVPGTLINLNLQSDYEYGYYMNQYKQIALQDYLIKHNKTLMDNVHDSARYSKIASVHSGTLKILRSVGEVQVKMVQISEGTGSASLVPTVLKTSDDGVTILYDKLKNPFKTEAVKNFLSPGTETRKNIETGIENYLKGISGYIPADKMKVFTDLLNPSNFFSSGTAENGVSTMSGLHSLELLKNSILATEAGVMKTIVTQ